MVQREHGLSRETIRFYPLGLPPGIWELYVATLVPAGYVFAVMKDNMSQNDGAEVVSFDYLHGYNPEDLLVTHGIPTAALTLPE